ncbi:hypothetical protein N781_16815 [Pontibacillus halophilus JSM 076056 = DSM 19796]|uniref:Uncharacterized protein n=1 Tax=Pontibacillus halophilus JSM 076056 = DSM 19796 TaxID=1385510 RepID=A0A0A5GMZ6_9BACI|nr:hypothetical protein [Pontibacillus halophilus]KGX92505.1 hypothetical protein N781_16815 [Pontibacillus halophilus JSM 076056 = DSM 19796]
MTAHYFIATCRPIPEYHKSENKYPFLSGEAYKELLPFSLPYVYELGGEDIEFLSFLDSFMGVGDIVEQYIYEEGRHGYPLSHNYPEESRTINLYRKTYKDQYGEYKLDNKNWKEELARRTIASKRSVTTFIND